MSQKNSQYAAKSTYQAINSATGVHSQSLSKFSDDIRVDDNSTEENKKQEGAVADEIVHVEKTSRYANDFEQLEEIGRGGFGIVYKARHRLDGNIYAIKKIMLSKKLRPEEFKRIRREITYLSSLNNQYIVRYF